MPRRRSWLPVVAAFVIALAIPRTGNARQEPALLAITLPAGGSVVSPGQTISVTVTSPAGATFGRVGLVGTEPIGAIGVVESLPGNFSAEIPATAAQKRYKLTALGTTVAGQSAMATIQIDVERSDMPIRITARLDEIVFEAAGQSHPMTILARFADGAVLDVTQSSNIAYASSDPTVATVDADGIVTSVGAGAANIIAKYGPAAANRRATVPVVVPDPPFTLSSNLLDFGDQKVGISSSQVMTLTNSGGDGLTIDAVTVTDDFTVVDTCVSLAPKPANSRCTITVTFAPTAAGRAESAVTIENSRTTITVRIKGMGIAAPSVEHLPDGSELSRLSARPAGHCGQ